ncbi:MAG TPA: glycosyltransferase family 4 protein [Thermoplasmata archaeon]|nr:glycosyltransferase family 4 protein [Thermoplasmata archaeon]
MVRLARAIGRSEDTKLAIAAPEYGRIWGGIGTYLSQLLQGMGPRVEVTILGGSSTSSEGNVTTIPMTDGGGVMTNYLRFQLALRKRLPEIIREHRPDLFIVHHAQMPDLLASTNGCPVVVTTHTTILGQSRGIQEACLRRSPLDVSERTTLAALPALLPAEIRYWSRARHALFVSGAVRDEVMAAYAPRLETSTTIPNGLSLGPEVLRPSEPDGSVLYTGRLLGWKGLAVLLHAMTRLPDRERLFVTGSGQVDTWRRYAESLGLRPDRVTFLGVVPREELLDRLRRASLVVVPSFMESCPYSLIEAMTFGKPVVASAVPGILDMVEHERSAWLVPPGDPEALAAGMARVLGDETLARRLGSAAAAAAQERFSLTRMCDETLRYFERVLAAS